jgi:hypothetical protein
MDAVHQAMAGFGSGSHPEIAGSGRPVVTIETAASDRQSAADALNARATRLLQNLARYGCRVDRQDIPVNRGPFYRPG